MGVADGGKFVFKIKPLQTNSGRWFLSSVDLFSLTMCVLTIVTEKKFDDVNHSGRNEWKTGLHLPKSLIVHNKRSDHLRKSVNTVVDLGETPCSICSSARSASLCCIM